MKVLSAWQPYAQLMVLGSKGIETRGWPLGVVPQRIAIHAAKSVRALREVFTQPHFYEALEAAGFTHSEALPLGALVGTVEVYGCTPTEEVDPAVIGMREYAFGDYGPKRFAWHLRNQVSFPPIPMVGHQGLRELPPDILAFIPERAL
jgi:hypothetical protein